MCPSYYSQLLLLHSRQLCWKKQAGWPELYPAQRLGLQLRKSPMGLLGSTWSPLEVANTWSDRSSQRMLPDTQGPSCPGTIGPCLTLSTHSQDCSVPAHLLTPGHFPPTLAYSRWGTNMAYGTFVALLGQPTECTVRIALSNTLLCLKTCKSNNFRR